MANSLMAVIGADTVGFQKSIDEARDVLQKYKNEAKGASSEISNNVKVTNQQVTAYQRVVNQLNKVNSGSMAASQQQKNLSKQIQELKIQWANLSNEAKSSDFGKSISNSLKVAESQLKTLNAQIDITNGKLKNSSNTVKGINFNNVQGQIGNVTNAMGSLGMQGASTISSLSSMGGALVNPYTAGAAAIAGATYALVDYNKTLSEQVAKVQEFANVSDEGAVSIRNGVKSICDTYNTDFNETIKAANSLAQHMGISYTEALDQISLGFAAGANASGDFLDQLDEYSTYLKEAGMNTSQMISLLVQSQKQGVFSDKALDTIKEANLRLREMPTATQQALQAIGMDVAGIETSLREGSSTTIDVVKKISEKLNELPPQSSEVGQAIADIFGGPGEDAGLEYLKTLKDIGDNTDAVMSKMTEQQRATYELQKADKDLEDALASLFSTGNGGFKTMYTVMKTKVYNAIVTLINGFIDLYNKSTLVRAGVASFTLQFKNAWAIIKGVCKHIGLGLSGIAEIMEDIINLDFAKAAQDWDKLKNNANKNFQEIGTNLVKNIRDSFEEGLHGKINRIKVSVDTDVDDTSLRKSQDKVQSSLGGGKSKTSNKGGKVEVKPEEGSLTYLENQLSELQKKYKDGLIKVTPTEYRKQVSDLQKQIADKKIQMQLDWEESIKKLDSEVDNELKKINQKKQEKTTYKTTGIKEEADNSPEGKIASMKDVISENDEAINKNLDTISELSVKQAEVNDLLERMNELLGEDKGSWSDEQVKKYNELAEAAQKYNGEIEKLKDTNKGLEKTNGGLVETINQTQESLDKTRDRIQRVTDTQDMINSLGGSFSTMGNAIGGTEGQMVGLVGTTMQSVATMIPQIMSLFAAHEAEAIAGATEAGASLPFPANIAAIAAGVASVIAAFAQVGSFASGGIIGGSSSIGDHNLARVNGGEMILNGSQQSKLFKLLNSDGGYVNNSGGYTSSTVKIKGSDLYLALKNYGKSSPNAKKL